VSLVKNYVFLYKDKAADILVHQFLCTGEVLPSRLHDDGITKATYAHK
jgi:hypothetical protein